MTVPAASVEQITRKVPIIDPVRVAVDSSGHHLRTMFVRLPADFTSADLNEPTSWSRVQKDRTKALRKFDRLFMVAADESWVAEALVSYADLSIAVLAKPNITKFPERYTPLPHDDAFRVIWTGAGYAVQRIADGHQMTAIVSSVQMAERDLRTMRPRPV